jgi:glycosyltransferase involved in cell wall biosynthesis
MPIVTVIMPCFNHGRYIRESIEGVLSQTFSDLELIVVDDCSKDSSAAEVMKIQQADPRVQLLRHSTNFGPSQSRNDGIAAAQGQFIAFCDADDIWLPDKLGRQMELLQSQPECGLTYCDAAIIDQSGVPTGRKFSELFPPPGGASRELFAALCIGNFINTQSVLVRRELLTSAQWFDERIRCNEDWWLWLRLSRLTKFIYEPAVLAKYRVHPAGTYQLHPKRYKRDLWRLCKRNLRSHADMPRYLQGWMWYKMGLALCSIGKRHPGLAFMRRGIADSILGGASIFRTLQMTARFFQATAGRSLERH